MDWSEIRLTDIGQHLLKNETATSKVRECQLENEAHDDNFNTHTHTTHNNYCNCCGEYLYKRFCALPSCILVSILFGSSYVWTK